MRLDAFITSQTMYSRSEAAQLIRRGRVTVNGGHSSRSDSVDPERDTVAVDGERIIYREHVYIMLNKPSGFICATKDALTPTVMELIPPSLRRKGLFPAGRLDKDTSGFVLITDDGAYAHRILSPKSHVEKEYIVTLRDPAHEGYKALLEEGITIDGGEKCLPAQMTFTDDPRVIRLVIHEGKYHQIKRMMHALGNEVTALKRIRIGGIVLDPHLPEGQCREIDIT